MSRVLGAMILGAVVCSTTSLSPADEHKTAIKGGIEGKIKKVDADAGTLTITTEQGRDRTFAVNDETTIVGPRGGKVRHRLKDHRFHEGMALTVVAEGNKATEIHLGFQHQEGGEAETTSAADRPSRMAGKEAPAKAASDTPPANRGVPSRSEAPTAARGKTTPGVADQDEDQEVPGKIKRVDATRHMLVVTLLNGKDRAFLVSKDVPVLVTGAPSKQGLQDPALKPGASVEVVTDEGGHKVKEVKLTPASALKRRKAG